MADRAVIFDMDGVLVDSYQAHLESWRELGAEHGLTMTDDEFSATFGRTSRDIIRNLWGDAIADADVAAADDRKEAMYREIIKHDFPAMDGATELLRGLHAAGFALAIGSSGPPENVAAVCECLPGAELISAQVTGTDVTRGKPDPQVFLIAADKLGVDPSHCAVVEDAPAGVEAARAAGMAAIAITGTADRSELRNAGAHFVVDSLRELTVPLVDEIIDSFQWPDKMRVAKWVWRLAQIHVAAQRLAMDHHIFTEAKDIIANSPVARQPSHFHSMLTRSYNDAVVMQVRRLTEKDCKDKRRRTLSIPLLLSDMRDHHKLLSKERHVRLWQRVPSYRNNWQHWEHVARRDFDGLCGSTAEYFPAQAIEEDLQELQDAVTSINALADTTIAHQDITPFAEPVTYPELEAAIELIEKILKRYGRLLKGSMPFQLLPEFLYDWKAIFRAPWITSPGTTP